MADNEGVAGDSLTRGRFSQLLFADDVVGLDTDGCFNYASSLSNVNPPKLLCFGGYRSEIDLGFPQKSGVTCSDSSSASSTNNGNAITLSKSKKKRNGYVNEPVLSMSAGAGVPVGSQANCKKTKSENSTVARHAKVKTEKLGERIAALQQLVSPFGKTDTASVLHEAMGYIRFLHEQVQVLCSPYLQPLPSSTHDLMLHEGEGNEAEDSTRDLRSRGLCLVPVESTIQVASSNGADFWSPATRTNASSQH